MSDSVNWPGSLNAVDQIFKFLKLKYRKIDDDGVDTVFGAKVDKHTLLCLVVDASLPNALWIEFFDKIRGQRTSSWGVKDCSKLQLDKELGGNIKRVIITAKDRQVALIQRKEGKNYIYTIE